MGQAERKITFEEARKILRCIADGQKVPQIIYDVIKDIAIREIEKKKRVVIIKRDPDIHRRRIQAAYAKIIDGETLEIPPQICAGFGADFDGDSVYCDVILHYKDLSGNLVSVLLNISEVSDVFRCKLVNQKVKDNGVIVKEYEFLEDVYILAIDINTGKSELKKVNRWSVHENIKMYDIEGKDIEKFSVSEDHSLVVYDEKENKIIRTSISEVLKEPNRYYLIKYRGERNNENNKIS